MIKFFKKNRAFVLAGLLLASFPAIASDFSGFVIIFIGLPASLLLTLLIGSILSLVLGADKKSGAWAAFALCVVGIIAISGWLGVFFEYVRSVFQIYIFAISVEVVAVISYFMFGPGFLLKLSSWILFSVQVSVSIFLMANMVKSIHLSGDYWLSVLTLPILLLVAVSAYVSLMTSKR